MTNEHENKYWIIYRLDGERRFLKARGISVEEVRGKTLLYLLDKYKGSVIVDSVSQVNEVVPQTPEMIANYVIHFDSMRIDRETEKEAEDLTAAVENEFKKLGVADCYWCWVIGTSVHTFPVYYEMEGSLNYLERTGQLNQEEEDEKEKTGNPQKPKF